MTTLIEDDIPKPILANPRQNREIITPDFIKFKTAHGDTMAVLICIKDDGKMKTQTDIANGGEGWILFFSLEKNHVITTPCKKP